MIWCICFTARNHYRRVWIKTVPYYYTAHQLVKREGYGKIAFRVPGGSILLSSLFESPPLLEKEQAY